MVPAGACGKAPVKLTPFMLRNPLLTTKRRWEVERRQSIRHTSRIIGARRLRPLIWHFLWITVNRCAAHAFRAAQFAAHKCFAHTYSNDFHFI
jgi:hypothetical protein